MELDDADCRVRYVVPDVLPEAQVGAFIAGKKTFKTGIAADLGFSVATGTPFLGVFPVELPGRVVFISGEVGRAGLKEWFARIADARGMSLRDAPDLELCSELPDLSSRSSIRYVAERCRDAALCVIDPMYMAFKVSGEDAKNVYAMGDKLGDLPRISQVTGCSVLVLHHAKNAKAEQYNVGPSLSDVAFTGVGEVSRFWLLTKHRRPYRPGKGSVYFRAEGQSGHATEKSIDIDEGTRTATTDRYWRVSVTEPKAMGEKGRIDTAVSKGVSGDDAKVLAYLKKAGIGATVNELSLKAFAPSRKRKEGVRKILVRLQVGGQAAPRTEERRGKQAEIWTAT